MKDIENFVIDFKRNILLELQLQDWTMESKFAYHIYLEGAVGQHANAWQLMDISRLRQNTQNLQLTLELKNKN